METWKQENTARQYNSCFTTRNEKTAYNITLAGIVAFLLFSCIIVNQTHYCNLQLTTKNITISHVDHLKESKITDLHLSDSMSCSPKNVDMWQQLADDEKIAQHVLKDHELDEETRDIWQACSCCQQKNKTMKRILSSINQRPAMCWDARSRRRIVRSTSAGINMFKLTVMIRITFLQCTRAKIVPVNTGEDNYGPTQPSI